MVIIRVFFYVLTIYLLVNACLAGEKRSGSCGSFEADIEEPGEKQFGGRRRGTSKSKKRQKDFVNRNIEVGQSSRTHRMTWHEPPVCFSTLKDTDLFLWRPFFSSSPPTDGVRQEGRGVPGGETASGRAPPRDR